MQKGVNVLGLLVVGLMLSITGFFVVFQEPERAHVTSEDGSVRVEGLSRVTQQFTIDSLDEKGGFFTASYEVAPSGVHLDQPAYITVKLPEDAPSEPYLYRYSDRLRMWESQQVTFNEGLRALELETWQLGTFAVGTKVGAVVPQFLHTIDELLELAPQNAVGYEYAIGVSLNEGPVIRVEESGGRGGCDGKSQRGNAHEWSQKEQSARILVNDVEQEVRLFFIVQWSLSGEGCGEGVEMIPLKDDVI